MRKIPLWHRSHLSLHRQITRELFKNVRLKRRHIDNALTLKEFSIQTYIQSFDFLEGNTVTSKFVGANMQSVGIVAVLLVNGRNVTRTLLRVFLQKCVRFYSKWPVQQPCSVNV